MQTIIVQINLNRWDLEAYLDRKKRVKIDRICKDKKLVKLERL